MKLANEALERVAGLSRQEFHSRFLDANRPVILEGEVAKWPAAKLWDASALAERFGDRPVRANVHPTGVHSGHGVTHEQTTLSAVLAPIAEDTRLRSLVMHVLTQAPYLIPDYSIPSVVGPEEVEASGFWIKPQNTTSGLHFDHQNGLLAVVRGRKRLLLFSPDQHELLYPCAVRDLDETMRRNWSAIFDIFRAPDLARFPRFAEAVAHEVILEEGQILFIPKFWWHAVDNQAPVTISVNFFLRVTHETHWPVFYADRVLIERLLAALPGT